MVGLDEASDLSQLARVEERTARDDAARPAVARDHDDRVELQRAHHSEDALRRHPLVHAVRRKVGCVLELDELVFAAGPGLGRALARAPLARRPRAADRVGDLADLLAGRAPDEAEQQLALRDAVDEAVAVDDQKVRRDVARVVTAAAAALAVERRSQLRAREPRARSKARAARARPP